MKRILIIGCGGAGKSTMARQLGDKLNIPVVHLDKLWWKPGWVESDREAFDAKLAEELQRPQWIMDGNYNRTMSQRLQRCDTVIYLDYPRWQCVLGVLKRILSTYGRVRLDMGEGCKERFDWEFLRWVWDFNKNNRSKLYALLEEAETAEVIVLKSRREGNAFLERISAINTRA